MSSSRVLCCLPSVKKQKHDFNFFSVQCIIKQLLDSVFVISKIIEVSVRVISLSLRLRLIRDGPLEKGWGVGGGEFSACTNFFFCSLPVQEFFFRVKPSARIFFQANIAFFSVKSRFIIYFALNKLFYTHNRSKDTGHFLILCARSFRKSTERGGSNPECFPMHFCSPCLLDFLCDKNGVKNSYPGVIAALKVLFELICPFCMVR